MINVRFGPAATDNATLALAADDLYLLGFKNRTENWHILKGGFKGLPAAAGSTVVTLPMGENYGHFVSGGHKNLVTVPLGRQSAIQAARDLASYDSSKTPDRVVKQAMARFMVMFSEAMRFRVVRDTFEGRWDEKTFITKKVAEYIVYWGKLSRLLIKWQQSVYRPWGGTEDADAVATVLGIKNANDAWLVLDFLLLPY